MVRRITAPAFSLAPQPQGQGMNLGGANPYQMPRVPYGQDPFITTAAFSLLGAPTLNQGLANIAQNAPAGLAAKTAMQRDIMGQQENAGKRAAMNAILKLKSGKPITPQEQAAIDANPEVMLQFGMPEPHKYMEVDGQVFDETTGRMVDLPGAGGAGGGPFRGTALDAQDSNIIARGQTDDAYRASTEYKLAWSRQFETPKLVSGGVDENGNMISTPVLPPIPAGLKGPTGPATTGPDQQAPTPTDAGRTAAPIVTGTKPLTEQQRRQRQLYDVVAPELEIVKKTFPALKTIGNQLGGMLPGAVSSLVTSPEYQQARNAMRTIIATYLYSTSGATANPGEVENQIDILMPRPGESEASTAQKLRRVETMVESIKTAGSPGTAPAAPPSASDPVYTSPSGAKVYAE